MITIVVTIAVSQYLGNLRIRSEVVQAAAAFTGVVGFALAAASSVYVCMGIDMNKDHLGIKASKSVRDRMNYSDSESEQPANFQIEKSTVGFQNMRVQL